ASLVSFALEASIGWHNRAGDAAPFREAQTAITAYYMVGARPRLAYETPVLGPPWSIPFELPVYQWSVAGLTTAVGTPLESTARAVGILYLLLCLWPAYYLLRELGLNPSERLLGLSFFLFSPFYAFWSRSFMIESTALFWSLSYCALARGCQQRPSVIGVILAMGAGAMAAAIKITTLVPFALAVGLWSFPIRRADGTPRVPFIVSAALLIVPLVCGWDWTRYADSVKSQSPYGPWLPSSTSIEWVFGRARERLDSSAWMHLIRSWALVIGHRL